MKNANQSEFKNKNMIRKNSYRMYIKRRGYNDSSNIWININDIV